MIACAPPSSAVPSFSSPRKPRLTSPYSEEAAQPVPLFLQERRNAVARIYLPESVRAKVILQKPAQLKNIPPSVRQQQCREMRRQTQLRKLLQLQQEIKEQKVSCPIEVAKEEAEVQYQMLAVTAAQRTARHVTRIWVTRARDRAVRHIVRDRRERAAKFTEETAASKKIQWAYRCHSWRKKSEVLLRLFALIQDAKTQAEREEEQAFRHRISQRQTEEEKVAEELQRLYFSVTTDDSTAPPLTLHEFHCATLEPFCDSLISRIRSDIERSPIVE